MCRTVAAITVYWTGRLTRNRNLSTAAAASRKVNCTPKGFQADRAGSKAAQALKRHVRYDSGTVPFPGLPSPLRRWFRLVAAAAIAVALAAALGAEPLTSIPNPRTRDGSWVTDMAGALRPETIARLNSTIGDLERTNGAEMAVVVIKSLDGLAVEEAAVKLFELWGIGKKHKDNGLLLLWSTGDRRVRVEVGYGLEGALPDGKVGAILDTYVIPKFKARKFRPGRARRRRCAGPPGARRAGRTGVGEERVVRADALGAWHGCSPAYSAPSRRRLARSPESGDGAAIAGGAARNVSRG